MNYYISQAILTRIKADTGTGGLYESGSYHIITGAHYLRADDAAARPYIVFNVTQDSDPALTSASGECLVTFRIVSDASDGGLILQTIWNRLFGDAMLQTNRVPTYGLDRHALTLPTNPLSATSTQLIYLGSSDVLDSDDATMEWDMRFKLNWDAAAVSP